MMHRGIYFDGVKAYAELPNIKLSKFTICYWIKKRDIRSWRYPVANEGAQPFSNGVKGWRFNTGLGTEINFDLSENSSNYVRLTAKNIELEKWYFVVGRWDGSYAELLIDLDIVDSKSFSGDITNDLPITLGSCNGGGAKCNCYISDFMIYNRWVEDDELQRIVQNKDNPPRDGLVVWLPFVENMGVIAKDYSGNNNHARLYNCKWVSRARRGIYFDNGGIKFNSGLNIDCNYCSVVAVFAIETLAKGGTFVSGRNCIVRPNGGQLMLYSHHLTKKLTFTNYDGTWKTVSSNIDPEAGQIYTGVGIMNGNEEHIYVASNGVIIDHNYRDDLGDCGEYTDATIYIGSRGDGKYALHGEVLAVMIYNRPITEDEIKQISDLGWFDPPRDGLISWILFDGLKEGDEVKDLITGAVGEPIGTPKFVMRKPKRVLVR